MGRKLMVIAWPAFLCACVLQAVVFSVVDPQDLVEGPPWSRQAVYAAGFLVFWVAAMGSSALTALLLGPAEERAGMR